MRKILPRGNPFDDILDEEMKRIDRPLKSMNWRTLRETYAALLHHPFAAAIFEMARPREQEGLAFGAHQARS